MKILQYILPICFLILNSCSERINFSQEHQPKITLLSEFTSGGELVVRASASGGLGMGQSIFYPNLDIKLINEKGDVKSIRLPDEDNPSFYFNNQLQLIEGEDYTLTAVAKDMDIQSVTAITRIPASGQILEESFELLEGPKTVEGTITENFAKRSIKVKLELEPSADPMTYYHLEIYRHGSDEGLHPVVISNLELTDLNACEDLEHKHGILIDFSKLVDNFLELELTSVDALNLDTEDLDKINIVLKTTTKDYYDYHLKLSAQIRASVIPNNAPIINFSNISNGYGLFSGFSADEMYIEL